MGADLGIEDRLRRMSRPPRSKSMAIRFTEQEAAQIAAAAKASGVAEREWARGVLLQNLNPVPMEMALFTELMGMRLFMNTVLRAVATGREISEKDFAAFLTEAKKGKHDTAREVLAQYQPTDEGDN